MAWRKPCYRAEMKTGLLIVGILCIAMGLLWIGQGLGWVLWPRSSFMLNQPKWSWYGTALAIAGVVLMMLARR
ncbi:MAG: hypothetical protein ACM30I_06625 [Gemmatimonas sp.]